MLYMLDKVHSILNVYIMIHIRCVGADRESSSPLHQIPEENQDRCHVSSDPPLLSPLLSSCSLKRSLVLTPSRPIAPSATRDAHHPAGVSPPPRGAAASADSIRARLPGPSVPAASTWHTRHFDCVKGHLGEDPSANLLTQSRKLILRPPERL